MNTLNLAVAATFAVGLAACSQTAPVPRDQLAAYILPITKIEERSQRVVSAIQILSKAGLVENEVLEELKLHYDIYYIYHAASTIDLAKGDIQSYLAHIKLAEAELEGAEQLLKDSMIRGVESQMGEETGHPKLGL